MYSQGLAEDTPQGIRLISDEIDESLNIVRFDGRKSW